MMTHEMKHRVQSQYVITFKTTKARDVYMENRMKYYYKDRGYSHFEISKGEDDLTIVISADIAAATPAAAKAISREQKAVFKRNFGSAKQELIFELIMERI